MVCLRDIIGFFFYKKMYRKSSASQPGTQPSGASLYFWPSQPHIRGSPPVLMRLIWPSALIFLAAVPLTAHATPIALWDDMQVKHSWNDVPADWESLGHSSAGTTIDIDIALKSDRETAVIDALSEISNPEHPKHVLPATTPLAPSLTRAASLHQISSISFQGTA